MKQYQETLYKLDSKGKQRQWEVGTDGDEVVVRHGATGGKITEKRITAKPKNTGKKNATTGAEQALLEAQSKWTKQVDREDYHYDIDLAGRQLRPMLALDYNKASHRVDWQNAYAQPKLDGLRLVIGHRFEETLGECYELEMLTRKGEVYQVEHLRESAISLMRIINMILDEKNQGHELRALDGEAYLHGLKCNQINSRCKAYKKGLTEEIEFHLFDLVIPNMTFVERQVVLIRGLNTLGSEGHNFKKVSTVDVHSEAHMKEYHGDWTQEGYEGAMIRHADSQYGIAQRSADLFKYKTFMDAEFKIVGMTEDISGNAMLTVQIDTEGAKGFSLCDVTPKRTHAFRKQMLLEPAKWIGQWITVKFQGYTEYGSLEFPVGMGLRECDDEGNPLH